MAGVEDYPVCPGIALIISVKTFKTGRQRLGAQSDFYYLKSTFTVSGFKTFPAREKLDWSLPEFIRALEHSVRSFHDEAFQSGPFFLCFSTHGDANGITLSDGTYVSLPFLRDILARQETLQNRPKVIVIQACRGNTCMTKEGPKLSSFVPSIDSPADPWGDTMGIASCVQTRTSYSSNFGSIFIMHFCNELLSGLLRDAGCTVQDVKKGVVRAMKGIREFDCREIVYTTPEVFCDNLKGTLCLKPPTNREDVKKLRQVIIDVISKMPREVEAMEEIHQTTAPSPDESTHESEVAKEPDMTSIAEGQTPYAGSTSLPIDVNGLVDQLLDAARAEVSSRDQERVPLPDISEKLKQKVGPLKISGTFIAFHGWAKSLASLRRNGDAVMSEMDDRVILDIPLSLTELQIRYSYRVVLGPLRPGGHLTATVGSNALRLRASFPQVSEDACALVVDSFELTELGDIQVEDTALAEINPHLPKILAWVTDSVRDKISQTVREGLTDAIIKAGLRLDCSSLIRVQT